MDAKRETTLKVEGMSCSSCVRHVNGALRRVHGVASVDVRLKDRRVVVEHAPSATVEQLVGAIEDAGYAARAA